MKRATEKRTGPFRLAVLALAMGTLAGCEDGTGPSLKQPDDQSATEIPKSSEKATQRDVEAPEVFQITEAGLWDGRPSLGGIWVAHPDVDRPERVMIRNTANDKSTVGALFRRERALPGPLVQVSSDAAAALGMLAGAPAKIQVVALRRETVEQPPKAKAAAAKKVEEPAKTTAAVPGKPKEPAQTPEKPTKTADEKAETANTAVGNEEAPAKKKWWRKSAKSAEITEAKLDPIAGAAAAIAASEAASKPKAARSGTSQKASEGTSLAKPYVQVGTFNIEANAKTAANKVAKGGLNAEVRSLAGDDKTIWRVVVGPAGNRAERKEILTKVEGLGFTDAYIVKN